MQRLEGRLDDPYLESALQLAVSWIRPIVDDVEGALQAASTALAGFRRQNEPFRAWAALTVGLLEMTLGRHDVARGHLTEASELGGQFGNHWLEASARTLLASLAVRVGHLDEARALLVKSVDARETVELSTQSVTFSLIASAELALAHGNARHAASALGAADGLRQRAGLRPWPSMRRSEAELHARVSEKLGLPVFEEVFATGSQLNRREAIALVRSLPEVDASGEGGKEVTAH
jgi:ATP/maltotriose-dependent transcriptional regulator MalT